MLTLPVDVLCPEHAGMLMAPHPLLSPHDCSYLDGLAATAVQQAGDYTPCHLYGMVRERSNLVTVYAAVACSKLGNEIAKTMVAQYWGIDHHLNEVLQVPSNQNEDRACIAVLVRIFQIASPSQTLVIYSMSQYAIHAFAYDALGNSEQGWHCPNSDLLMLGVALLRQRAAAVQLRWVPNDGQNGHLKLARALEICGL